VAQVTALNKVMIHANIDNFGFDLIVTCQNVNGCSAIEK